MNVQVVFFPPVNRLTVVVPVYRGGSAFKICLAAIAASTVAPDEVIVVLDGSDDDSESLALSHGFRTCRVEKQSGPARARNVGAAAARTDLLLFIDSDVAVHRETVGFVKQFFAERPGYSAMMGNYDRRPPAPNLLSQYKNLLQHFVHRKAAADTFTFWGACGGIRREAFLAVGGFDAEYGIPCIEDIELGARLIRAGHRLALCAEIEVTHLKRWSARSLFVSDVFRRAIPWTRVIHREGVLPNDLNTGYAARLRVALAWLLPLAAFAGFASPLMGSIALAVLAAALLFLDRDLLGFFARERGVLFAAAVIPWHWFHHFYCGMGFIAGTLLHGWDMLRDRRVQTADNSTHSQEKLSLPDAS